MLYHSLEVIIYRIACQYSIGEKAGNALVVCESFKSCN